MIRQEDNDDDNDDNEDDFCDERWRGFLIRQEEGGAPTSPFLTFLLITPITTSLSSSPSLLLC